MKSQLQSDEDTVDKLNAFYIYKTAGEDRVREILPQQANFCQSNSNKSYHEVRNELLKACNSDATH